MHLGSDDDDEAEDSDVESKSLERLLDELYSFLTAQLALHMQHTYASHVLRVLLEVLAGRRVADEVVRSRLSRDKGKGLRRRFRGTLNTTRKMLRR